MSVPLPPLPVAAECRVLVSWQRCDCAPARAAHPERAAWGHLEVACGVPGCRLVWYDPAHEPQRPG